jgi:hypothetical protein
MGSEDFSLPGIITITALAGVGVVLLTAWCASRFKHWWYRHSHTG